MILRVFRAQAVGPTGLGALYGKVALLDAMPPYQGGGEMIESVSFAGTTYNQLPYKFEAGTPDIAGVIAFGAAIDYLNQLDRAGAAAHEKALLAYAEERAKATPGCAADWYLGKQDQRHELFARGRAPQRCGHVA
ncbi:aminotransferase class V-fold PLP-dependent enzyme [Halopseudomonas pachastrellae]|nr:aminotransferase class V-fold PLP-dependent enzyme [Halopseudomonas pachastrellae]